jgi:hypothetical protein
MNHAVGSEKLVTGSSVRATILKSHRRNIIGFSILGSVSIPCTGKTVSKP